MAANYEANKKGHEHNSKTEGKSLFSKTIGKQLREYRTVCVGFWILAK